MGEERKRINAACPRFVCRACRTKTGWPHQRWCALAERTEPACGDCRYYSAPQRSCGHPSNRKDGDAP